MKVRPIELEILIKLTKMQNRITEDELNQLIEELGGPHSNAEKIVEGLLEKGLLKKTETFVPVYYSPLVADIVKYINQTNTRNPKTILKAFGLSSDFSFFILSILKYVDFTKDYYIPEQSKIHKVKQTATKLKSRVKPTPAPKKWDLEIEYS